VGILILSVFLYVLFPENNGSVIPRARAFTSGTRDLACTRLLEHLHVFRFGPHPCLVLEVLLGTRNFLSAAPKRLSCFAILRYARSGRPAAPSTRQHDFILLFIRRAQSRLRPQQIEILVRVVLLPIRVVVLCIRYRRRLQPV
jgi:hypothetical protein